MSDEERKTPPPGEEGAGEAPEAPQADAPPEGGAAPGGEPSARAAAEGGTGGEGASPAPEAGSGEGGGGADADAAAREAKAKAEAAAAAAAAAETRAKAAAERAAVEAAKPPWERDAETPEWQDADADPLARAVRERFGEAVLSARTYAGELTFEIETGRIADVCRYLKGEEGYRLLVDVCGVDYPEREPRFDVVYHLYNLDDHRRIRLKVATDEATPVPTVSGVWRAANWPEREAYDMFGVRFADHPDMTRILLWEGFNGHPLRKDFPVEGIDTGSAIYPEYYTPEAGPVAGTGTGWKEPKPPEEPEAGEGAGSEEAPS